MGWLIDGMEHSMMVDDEQLLNELLITALPYLTSPFVALSLYFDALNHPGTHSFPPPVLPFPLGARC